MGRRNRHQFVTNVTPAAPPDNPPSEATLRETTCAIRKCNRTPSLRIGMTEGLICEHHASSIWDRVEWRDATQRDEQVPGMEGRDYVRADARAIRSTNRRKPTSMGQIYFVRIDDLIKVGWTTKLADRIRAYGPKAELLANYPASRADEAALHRQLTPSRFRGREWYSNTDIIRAFIDEALERHGRPRFERLPWTEPKTSNIKPKSMR